MKSSSESEPARVFQDWFESVWNQGDTSAVARLFPADGKAYGLLPDPEAAVEGPAPFEQFQAAILGLVEDVNVSVLHMITQGDEVMAICRFRAAKRVDPSAAVDFCFAAWSTVRDGRIIAARNVVDFQTFLVQLGLTPAETLPKALGMA